MDTNNILKDLINRIESSPLISSETKEQMYEDIKNPNRLFQEDCSAVAEIVIKNPNIDYNELKEKVIETRDTIDFQKCATLEGIKVPDYKGETVPDFVDKIIKHNVGEVNFEGKNEIDWRTGPSQREHDKDINEIDYLKKHISGDVASVDEYREFSALNEEMKEIRGDLHPVGDSFKEIKENILEIISEAKEIYQKSPNESNNYYTARDYGVPYNSDEEKYDIKSLNSIEDKIRQIDLKDISPIEKMGEIKAVLLNPEIDIKDKEKMDFYKNVEIPWEPKFDSYEDDDGEYHDGRYGDAWYYEDVSAVVEECYERGFSVEDTEMVLDKMVSEMYDDGHFKVSDDWLEEKTHELVEQKMFVAENGDRLDYIERNSDNESLDYRNELFKEVYEELKNDEDKDTKLDIATGLTAFCTHQEDDVVEDDIKEVLSLVEQAVEIKDDIDKELGH